MAYKTQLTPNSWIQVIPNFFRITQEEYDELWSMRPEEPVFVQIMGKQIQIPRQQAVYGNSSYSFSGTTIKPRELTHPIMIKLKSNSYNYSREITIFVCYLTYKYIQTMSFNN